MPKKRASKPDVRKAAVGGKSLRLRDSKTRRRVDLESGDLQRDDRRATEPDEAVSAELESSGSGLQLKPGWAEAEGARLAQLDIEKNGKSVRTFVRSSEARMKMKLAQRARRAREHGETKRA